MQYNERLEDIRLLKIEIANIRSHKYLLTRGMCNVIDMRQEVLQLGRDLTQERVKSRALEEEMSTPMNIHRWHQLSGQDPEKMDLIFKVQTLQKYDPLVNRYIYWAIDNKMNIDFPGAFYSKQLSQYKKRMLCANQICCTMRSNRPPTTLATR